MVTTRKAPPPTPNYSKGVPISSINANKELKRVAEGADGVGNRNGVVERSEVNTRMQQVLRSTSMNPTNAAQQRQNDRARNEAQGLSELARLMGG